MDPRSRLRNDCVWVVQALLWFVYKLIDKLTQDISNRLELQRCFASIRNPHWENKRPIHITLDSNIKISVSFKRQGIIL